MKRGNKAFSFEGLTDGESKTRIFSKYCSGTKRTNWVKEANVIRRYVLMGMLGLLFAGCGGNPYLEASLDPAKLEGKDQAWFEENWGKPNAKTSRFFGGESWVYSRIAGGETHFPFFNFSPNQCQITLDFNKDQQLSDYSYTDC